MKGKIGGNTATVFRVPDELHRRHLARLRRKTTEQIDRIQLEQATKAAAFDPAPRLTSRKP